MILIEKPSTTGLVKQNSLHAKVKEIEDKIPGSYKFVTTRGFDKLTNISFDTKMKEAMKFLTTESGIKNALHVIDKKKKKILNKISSKGCGCFMQNVLYRH